MMMMVVGCMCLLNNCGVVGVQVYAEATVVFPLIVAATFAKAGQKGAD